MLLVCDYHYSTRGEETQLPVYCSILINWNFGSAPTVPRSNSFGRVGVIPLMVSCSHVITGDIEEPPILFSSISPRLTVSIPSHICAIPIPIYPNHVPAMILLTGEGCARNSNALYFGQIHKQLEGRNISQTYRCAVYKSPIGSGRIARGFFYYVLVRSIIIHVADQPVVNGSLLFQIAHAFFQDLVQHHFGRIIYLFVIAGQFRNITCFPSCTDGSSIIKGHVNLIRLNK